MTAEAYYSETDDCWYVPVAPELLKYDDDFKDGIEPVRVQLKDGQLWITRLEAKPKLDDRDHYYCLECGSQVERSAIT